MNPALEMIHDIADEGMDTPILLADGFEDALMGLCTRFGGLRVAAYDRNKCIDILIKRDGMDWEEAEEYFQFNTEGAWMGEGTPVFITLPS